MTELLTFWQDKRVVVTGGRGFLGSHVVDYLTALGAKDIFVPRHSDFDFRFRADAESMYRIAKPHIVIHLAAKVGGIAANQSSPGQFFYDNLMMGMQLMEAGKFAGLEKFVQMGSACEYPKHTEVPMREEDLWLGYPEETNAAYGIAKKALLVQGQAYRQQYGMNVIHLLSTNLYGPRDSFDRDKSHVIAALIRRTLEAKREGSESLSVWGTGNASRDFLHVRDAAYAVILAAMRYNDPEPVNLGSGTATTIHDVANMIREAVGFEGSLTWDLSKPDGQPRRWLDVSKAQTFGFNAAIPLQEGIKETAKWYASYRSGISI